MMELFNESINKCVDAFDEEAYAKLRKTTDLKRVMNYVNQENYSGLHWLALWCPGIMNEVEGELALDIPTALGVLDRKFANYDNTLEYLTKTAKLVNDKEWSVVTN